MRRMFEAMVPALFMLLAGPGVGRAAAEGGPLFPSAVAKVNGDEIPGSDLEKIVRRELSAIGNPEWKDLRGEYRGELVLGGVTSLVNARLIYQEAVRLGIKASDEDVQSEMEKYRKAFPDEAAMDAALAEQNLDRASFQKSLNENLVSNRFLNEAVRSKAVVTEEEMKAHFSAHPEELKHPEIVRTRHILIRAEGESPEQDAAARKRAEELLEKVRNGEDFAQLAAAHSVDVSSVQGGDLGFSARESLLPEYSETAFSLPKGGTGLVKTPFGYHVLQVTDKRPEGLFAFDDVKAQLEQRLKSQKSQKELDALIAGLRKTAKIEILLSAKELLNP